MSGWAYAGGSSGTGLGVLLVWITGLCGWAVPDEVAVVIGGLALSIGATLGHNGIEGTWAILLHGSEVLSTKLTGTPAPKR